MVYGVHFSMQEGRLVGLSVTCKHSEFYFDNRFDKLVHLVGPIM